MTKKRSIKFAIRLNKLLTNVNFWKKVLKIIHNYDEEPKQINLFYFIFKVKLAPRNHEPSKLFANRDDCILLFTSLCIILCLNIKRIPVNK